MANPAKFHWGDFPNVRDSWIVLLIDSVPVRQRPKKEAWPDRVLPKLCTKFGVDRIRDADIELIPFRVDGDLDNIDSKLWMEMAGEGGESSFSEPLNEVIDYLFNECIPE